MRIVKEAEERRNEILDVAELLFSKKGFDNTSTGDILEKVGIARGTLYYHFKSKEDILDGVIDRMIGQMLWKARNIIADKEVPILKRLTGVILAFSPDTETGQEMTHQMHKTQNALMHQKTHERLLAGIVPVLEELMQEGTDQGMFHTEHVTEALEMIMLYALTMFDEQMEQSPEEKQQRIMGFIYHSEQLLGTEHGLMVQAIMEIFEEDRK